MELFYSIPIITRSFLTACTLTTLAVHLDLVSPLKLYLRGFGSIMHTHEYWRFVTNFFFFDYIGLNFFLHMFFLFRYCKYLEQSSFRNRTADFLLFFAFCTASLLGLNYLITYLQWIQRPVHFMAPSLAFSVVYVWARRNPQFSMTFFHLLHFTAPWLPWVILGLGWIMGSPPLSDLLGIAVGHVYYFFSDVYPEFTGRHLLKAPSFLVRLFDEPDVIEQPPHPHQD